MSETFAKIPAPAAAPLARPAKLSEAGLAALDPAATPAGYLRRLVAEKLFADAIRFLAAALPKREAVWWACVCARDALPPEPPPAATAALAAAEAWVYGPDDQNRRAAKRAAVAANYQSAASWAAMAAFWSGGSLADPDAPAVAPDDGLLPNAVAGAILLAAVQHEPARAEERHRAFIDYGIDIANGGNGRPAKSAGA